MINLETISYGTKAWIIGTIMGLLGTFAIYKAFSVKFQKGMYIPTNAILISAVFVFIFILERVTLYRKYFKDSLIFQGYLIPCGVRHLFRR